MTERLRFTMLRFLIAVITGCGIVALLAPVGRTSFVPGLLLAAILVLGALLAILNANRLFRNRIDGLTAKSAGTRDLKDLTNAAVGVLLGVAAGDIVYLFGAILALIVGD